MNSRDLHKHIQTRTFLPVYLLYGEEDFFIERDVKILADAVLGDGDSSFNYDVFRGSEHKAAEVVAAANAFPFMAEKRIILVKEAERILNDEPLASYLQNPSPHTVLVLVAETLKQTSKKKSLRKDKQPRFDTVSYLKSNKNIFGTDITIEYKILRESALQKWMEEEFARYGKKITPKGCSVFLGLKESSTRVISNEIEKIHTALPEKAVIDEDDLFTYLGASKQYNIFELWDKVSERNTDAAQTIAGKMLETDRPTALVAFLSKQFTILWQVRSQPHIKKPADDDAKKVGLIWSWQYESMRKCLPNFGDAAYFEKCFEFILEADLELKSKPTDPRVIISRLIWQLTSS